MLGAHPWRDGAILVLVVALLLLFVTVVATGCGDQTDELDRLLSAYRAAAMDHFALKAQLTELDTKVDLIDPASKNASKAFPMIDDAWAVLRKMMEIEESMVALLDRMAELDLSEDMTTYIAMRSETLALTMAQSDLWKEYLVKLKATYEWDDLSRSQRQELDQDIGDIMARSHELSTQLQEKLEAAELYFIDNNLGGE